MNINPKELEKMSKSQYGKYTPSQPNPILAFLEKYLLRTTPARSYFNGAFTMGVLIYWWFTKEAWPLYIWVIYTVLINILSLIYWNSEKKRLEKEIQRCEAELKGIQKEIQSRKEYFDNLRRELEKNSRN